MSSPFAERLLERPDIADLGASLSSIWL